MIILDPDMYGCTVWLVNSPIIDKNKVTYIKGETIEEICKELINRLTIYKYVEICDGYFKKILIWKDCVYLDIAAMGQVYKDVFKHYGLPIEDVISSSSNKVIPVQKYVDEEIDNG